MKGNKPKKKAHKHTDKKQEPFFRNERQGDPQCEAALAIRRAEVELYGHYALPEYLDADIDEETRRIQEATGKQLNIVGDALLAYAGLVRLPRMRHMQEEHARLDIGRLSAINSMVSMLGGNGTAEVYALIDECLVNLFTPTKPNQELPARWCITRRLRKIIADFDADLDHSPSKRKKRENSGTIPPGECRVRFDGSEIGSQAMETRADVVTMATIRATIKELARDEKITQDQAVLKLLTGDITPKAKATIYGYAPITPAGDIVPGKAMYFPSCGWSGSTANEAFEEIADEVTVVDLKDVSEQEVGGYVPTDKMKALVRARDGQCIWPGCGTSAWRCQLDHRVPYDEGGPTTPDNLFSLCQHHHNQKTDRKAFYIPDPHSGEIIWLFSDGTYSLVEPGGFLHEQSIPVKPRWSRKIDQVRALNEKIAEFYARCHALVDKFDEDWDHASCIGAINDLEKEFCLFFPFKPDVPPVDPDDATPAAPAGRRSG